MTSESGRVRTPVRPSAPWILVGVPATILGVMLLLASAYASITHSLGWSASNPSALSGFGWLLTVAGAVCLGAGGYELAAHADRAAGYVARVPEWKDAEPRTGVLADPDD